MTLHARYGKLQTPAWPVFMCLAPSVNDSLSTSRYGEQLTLNQWVLGSSPRWCTKECLTRKCRAFFCCSILRRHDLVHRRRYSNRAAARSAVRNATVRRSLARGRVPGNVAGVERRGDGERQGLEIKKVQVCKSVYGNNKFDGSLLRNF